jgi:hypothetical protein
LLWPDSGRLLDGVFEAGDALVGDAGNLEEVEPERLVLAVFMRCI